MVKPDFVEIEWNGKGRAVLQFYNSDEDTCNSNLCNGRIECFLSILNIREYKFKKENDLDETSFNECMKPFQDLKHPFEHGTPPGVLEDLWQAYKDYWNLYCDTYAKLAWVHYFRKYSKNDFLDWYGAYITECPEVIKYITLKDDFVTTLPFDCHKCDTELIDAISSNNSPSCSCINVENNWYSEKTLGILYQELSCKICWLNLQLYLRSSAIAWTSEIDKYFYKNGGMHFYSDKDCETLLDFSSAALNSSLQNSKNGQNCDVLIKGSKLDCHNSETEAVNNAFSLNLSKESDLNCTNILNGNVNTEDNSPKIEPDIEININNERDEVSSSSGVALLKASSKKRRVNPGGVGWAIKHFKCKSFSNQSEPLGQDSGVDEKCISKEQEMDMDFEESALVINFSENIDECSIKAIEGSVPRLSFLDETEFTLSKQSSSSLSNCSSQIKIIIHKKDSPSKAQQVAKLFLNIQCFLFSLGRTLVHILPYIPLLVIRSSATIIASVFRRFFFHRAVDIQPHSESRTVMKKKEYSSVSYLKSHFRPIVKEFPLMERLKISEGCLYHVSKFEDLRLPVKNQWKIVTLHHDGGNTETAVLPFNSKDIGMGFHSASDVLEDKDLLLNTHTIFDEEGNPISVRKNEFLNEYSSDMYSWKDIKKKCELILYRYQEHCDVIPSAFQTEFGKYWMQRHRLFTKFDEGIQLDDESWYSTTPEFVAAHQASRCKGGIVIDAFCGSGGNTIQLAFTCRKVIAIDIDPVKIELAKDNAKIYGVEDKIEFIIGDFFTLCSALKADAVLLSPPWGGMSYLENDFYDVLSLGGCMDVLRLVNAARNISKNIALYLPRNSNIFQVLQLSRFGEAVDIEFQYIGKKKKSITAYFGDLAYYGGDF